MSTTASAKSAGRWSWSNAGSALSMAAIAGFVLASLWAKWSPVQAQEPPPPPKAAVPAAKAKPKPKSKVQTQAEAAAAVSGAGKKLDHAALARIIDEEVNKRLAAEGIKASPRSSDTEFLRRVYLDLIGVVPTAEQVQVFLQSDEPGKREKVIDELLADPRFGKSLAEAWSGLMIPRESNNRRLNHAPLQDWLAKQFNDGVPLDKLVFDLVTATGNQDENGAVTYFIGNPTVDKMTDSVTRMFLGVQLQCAQCHNHPFTEWKQNEYWAMAAFFMKTRLTVNPQQAAKKGLPPGIAETNNPKGRKKGGLPESAKIVPAKFLQGEQPTLNANEPYRPVLARWLTAPENPFFARAMVNRFWHQVFGRGLVAPVDDMHDENAPSHPDLLAALSEQFKSSGFDVKYLVRAMLNSEAYQRTSRPSGDNRDDTQLYSHRIVRVLSPEQLYDSLVTVLGSGGGKQDGRGRPAAGKKGPAIAGREAFLNFFRIDEGADPLEYQAGIPQALRLMNSAQVNNTQATVNRAMKEGQTPAQVIERLYLAALSRLPTNEETERMTEYVRRQEEPRGAYGDILWALINSSEFALNH